MSERVPNNRARRALRAVASGREVGLDASVVASAQADIDLRRLVALPTREYESQARRELRPQDPVANSVPRPYEARF